MVLQRIITAFVSVLFNNFKPKVNFARKFDLAIDPTIRNDGSLGFDLYSPYKVNIKPGERIVIDTGIIFEFPSYLGGFLWGKSSVALKKELSVCAGVVDPGYTGSIGIILQNCNSESVLIDRGDAIAQIIFGFAIRPTLITIEETDIPKTLRGERGFGGDPEWHTPKREFKEDDP